MPNLKVWSDTEIARMRRDMDRLFDDLCSDFDLPVMVCRMTGDLQLDEQGDMLIVRLELGNIDPENVSVSVDDRLLSIAAESTEVVDGQQRTRSIRKDLRLPCMIKTEEVEALFEDGVLVIHLPKCPPRGLPIRVLVNK